MFAMLLGSAPLFPQQTQDISSAALELPVVLKENIAAGKTPVGTKIEAKLVAATLVNGVVIPRDATLSGEVTASAAKTKTDPSRLALRIDSARWKDKSQPLHVFLTPWYFPLAESPSQDLSYQPLNPANSKKGWNGMGTYPDERNPAAQEKFPGRDQDKDAAASGAPSTAIEKRKVLMKSVEAMRNGDGQLILTSAKFTIKLDKVTTYVLASGDLLH
jgi:hypothetical protein